MLNQIGLWAASGLLLTLVTHPHDSHHEGEIPFKIVPDSPAAAPAHRPHVHTVDNKPGYRTYRTLNLKTYVGTITMPNIHCYYPAINNNMMEIHSPVADEQTVSIVQIEGQITDGRIRSGYSVAVDVPSTTAVC